MIIQWIKKIFGRKSSPERLPKPGETWWLDRSDQSPWESTMEPAPVKILDQREGWVRYSMGGLTFRDERMRVSSFIKIYKPKENDED